MDTKKIPNSIMEKSKQIMGCDGPNLSKCLASSCPNFKKGKATIGTGDVAIGASASNPKEKAPKKVIYFIKLCKNYHDI